MVFSSVIFCFGFLPVFLLLYYFLTLAFGKFPKVLRYFRNIALLLFSLLFYFWGETWLVFVMLTSTIVDYIAGLIICGQWCHSDKIKPLQKGGDRTALQRSALIISIMVNLGLLSFFKYSNFFIENLNLGFGLINPEWAVGFWQISLPLGISFYTFQSMSYTIDVYKGDTSATRNFIDFAAFVSMFPQLVAGPIVRYRDVADQLVQRKHSTSDFAYGVKRFTIGLSKKLLIADIVSRPADAIFALAASDLTPGLAFLGVLCYTLQIYFDFSGYSDMAIGLGRMLGFRYLENFNFPYIAQSIQDFWRRWHISLSSWFRDYLYIPLGGNRAGKSRIYVNLVVVFFLCGLWHGASWTFVAWGLFHGIFLVVERLGLGKLLEKIPRVLRHLYTLIVAMGGWVLFRSETFEQAMAFFSAMFGFAGGDGVLHNVARYADSTVIIAIVAGIIGSTPIWRTLNAWILENLNDDSAGGLILNGSYRLLSACLIIALLLLSAATMSSGTYSPFIYFRF